MIVYAVGEIDYDLRESLPFSIHSTLLGAMGSIPGSWWNQRDTSEPLEWLSQERKGEIIYVIRKYEVEQ